MTVEKNKLSLIMPVFNEEHAIAPFMARLTPVLESLDARPEIIFVNDGSTDGTLACLLNLRQRMPGVQVIDLMRNFGKDVALTAGLAYCSGDAAVPLDVDLQDPPEVIPELVREWREGHEMVVAVRRRRGDSALKNVSATLFYRIIRMLSDDPIIENAGDFRLLDRRAIDILNRLPEKTRFMKGLFAWPGFRTALVSYDRPERTSGESKWSFWRLWNFALDGIFSSSTLPLRIWTYVGALISSASLIYIAYLLIRTLIYGVDVPGYASTMVVILFMNGMLMVGIGIIGEYIGRIFLESKNRPLFLVRRLYGFGADEGERGNDADR